MRIRLNRTYYWQTNEPARKNTSLPNCGNGDYHHLLLYKWECARATTTTTQKQQPTNNTDNLETIIQQNNRIIQQNDETAIQDRAGAYIGTIALLVSLSLVIYGFQLSRGGKITQKAKRHYHIIILSLVVPVFILCSCCHVCTSMNSCIHIII